MPPWVLKSAPAAWAPFLSCAPNAALGPVNGPATQILIWALAAPLNARPAASASPDNHTFLIEVSLLVDTLHAMSTSCGLQLAGRRILTVHHPPNMSTSHPYSVGLNRCSRPPAPTEGTVGCEKPGILCRYLECAHAAEPKNSQDEE